jgi:hypothetical protein
VETAASAPLTAVLTVTVALLILDCMEVTVGVSGDDVLGVSACGVVDWLVDGVPLDEVTVDGSVAPLEEGDV